MLRNPPAKSPRLFSAAPQVQRRTVTEEVLDRLRGLLLKGELTPGTRIEQAELAATFGVSTVPVREALLRLQSAGLVEIIPHRGVFVTDVSLEELLDIYTTRELLEEQAARLAAAELSATDLETLEALSDAMQAAASGKQLDELLVLNREFHLTIYRAARRRHLLQLIEQLWDLSMPSAYLQLHAEPERASEALYEMRSIVSACERRDADALGSMIRGKVHQTTSGLLRRMSLPDTAPAKRGGSSPRPAKKKEPAPKKARVPAPAKKRAGGAKSAAKRPGTAPPQKVRSKVRAEKAKDRRRA